MRSAVPAGSVYFFELTGGEPEDLAALERARQIEPIAEVFRTQPSDRVVTALGRVGGPRAAEMLVGLLRDPEHKLAAATRKQMTVRFAMAAALRINRLVDPQGHADFWE